MEIKRILSFAFLVFLACTASGQGYPEGIYMSLEEIVARTPSQQMDLMITRVIHSDPKMEGIDDYDLVPDDKSVKRSFIKKEVWGYSYGEQLFLNTRQIKARSGYSLLLSDGRYMVFKAGESKYRNEEMKKQRSKVAANQFMFGIIGGLAAQDKLNKMRFLYAYDKETGEVLAIDRHSMQVLFADYPELLNIYLEEEDPEDNEVQLRYLTFLNKILARSQSTAL